MDNSQFAEQATERLSKLQPVLVSKGYLIREIKDKMKGVDKAKQYSRYKALQECLVLIEDAPES